MTTQIDIQNYKCVPLDILKNISKDNKLQVDITPTDVSLASIKEQQLQTIQGAGPIAGGKAFTADQMESFIINLVIAFAILFFVVILFYGGLNIRTYGWAAFRLPDTLRSMPIIAFAAIIFAILGFVIGKFT